MVTIADVARHAGVAPSTVSYVLTGKRSISAGTKSRVQESIRTLGYLPHAGDRAGRARTNVIGLVLPLRSGLHLPMMTRVVTSAVTAARRHDMDILLMTGDDGASGLRRAAGNGGADGFLVMDPDLSGDRVALLRDLAKPSILIGHPVAAKGLTCVDLDFEAAGAKCVDHLAELGHRLIGFLGAPSAVYRRTTSFAHRAMAGFSAAAMRRGIATTAVPAEEDYGSVLRAIQSLIRAHPSMTALVVHNDTALSWVVSCLRASGRKVPEDVAVIAICPDELAEQSSPPLTSVRMPAEDLGRHAVELLVARLDGRPAPPRLLLSPRLVRRVSTPELVSVRYGAASSG